MPMIDEYEKICGFSFKDRKETYEQPVLNSKSDAEYYAAIDAIIQKVPSFHTDLIGTGNAASLKCYNSKKYLLTEISYHTDIIEKNKYEKYAISNSKTYSFVYANGSYYFDTAYTMGDKLNKYDKIISIDGISADEYAVEFPQIFSLHYDGQYEKAYRTRFIFNDFTGEECKIEIEHKDKTTSEIILYTDNCFNEAFLYNYSPNVNSEAYDFEVVNDDDNKVSYGNDRVNGRYGRRENYF